MAFLLTDASSPLVGGGKEKDEELKRQVQLGHY